MSKPRSKKIVDTPRGEKTGSQPIEGFQIARIEDFLKNPNIPNKTKETYHLLYFDLIIICTEGKGKHLIDFKTYEFEAPAIFIIKKDQYHAWDLTANMKGFMLFFEMDFNLKLGGEASFSHINFPQITPKHPVLSIPNKTDLDLYKILSESLFKEFDRDGQINQLLKTYLVALLTKIESELIPSDSPSIPIGDYKIFDEFLQLLEIHIRSSRNANFYIETLGMSYNRLNSISKKITGFTLKQYIDEFILTKAKRSLFSSDKNISQISFLLGFDEVGNFSKYFKNKTGLSPLHFRNRIK
jgi:AraC family transcriptional activator of pobA